MTDPDPAREKRIADAARAVVEQWEAMGRCYIGAAEGVALADLLDALAAEVERADEGETDG